MNIVQTAGAVGFLRKQGKVNKEQKQ